VSVPAGDDVHIEPASVDWLLEDGGQPLRGQPRLQGALQGEMLVALAGAAGVSLHGARDGGSGLMAEVGIADLAGFDQEPLTAPSRTYATPQLIVVGLPERDRCEPLFRQHHSFA
jgi:hypothetical protein